MAFHHREKENLEHQSLGLNQSDKHNRSHDAELHKCGNVEGKFKIEYQGVCSDTFDEQKLNHDPETHEGGSLKRPPVSKHPNPVCRAVSIHFEEHDNAPSRHSPLAQTSRSKIRNE